MSPAARICVAAFVLAATTLVILVGLDQIGRGQRRFAGPGKPVDGARRVLVERPEEAVRVWQDAGVRGRIVVAITARWNRVIIGLFGRAAEDSHYPVTLTNMAVERSAQLDSANFLYVASLAGIARRIVAVLPDSRYRERLGQGFVGDDLPASLDSSFEGFPRSFTTLSRLSPPEEPVLLYLAAGAFDEEKERDWGAELARHGLRTDLVLYCLERGDDRVSEAARGRLLAFAGPGVQRR